MRAVQLRVNAAIRRSLYPKLEQFVPEDLRLDASDTEVFAAVRKAASEAISASVLNAHAAKVIVRVQKHSTTELARIGITLEDEPALARMLTRWRKQLVDTVKSVESDQLDRLENILRNNRGLRVEALRDKLDEKLDLGVAAAERLARNQVVMLSAGVNEERMQAAGIVEYDWTTAGNEKVSDAHAELDGQRFRFDDPPTDSDGNTGNPGLIRPNCQCTAYPVIPELDD